MAAATCDAKAPDGGKDDARTKIALRFGLLKDHFAAHEFVLGQFSIVDAYLTTVLNWCNASGIDVKQWTAVHAYHRRMLQRPSVARAFGEELTLYKEEKIRQAS